jgi:hypothetical protein
MFYWPARRVDGPRHGGAKAKMDADAVFAQLGLEPLRVRSRGALHVMWEIARWAVLRPRSILLFHYPTHNAPERIAIRLWRRRHRIVFLIHDIDALRGVSPSQPISFLEKASACIVTGRLDAAPEVVGRLPRVVRLGCWDYLPADDFEPPAWSNGEGVLFAGALQADKSAWLYDASRRTPLILAGLGLDEQRKLPGDRALGPFRPEHPVFPSEARWGLVWDGGSPDGLSGPTGAYQRYNQPHKFSLYISAGLPVICSRDAALARFVEETGVGLCVARIDEIPDAIRAIDPAQEKAIRAAVTALRERLRRGAFLKAAVATLRMMLDDRADERTGRPGARAARERIAIAIVVVIKTLRGLRIPYDGSGDGHLQAAAASASGAGNRNSPRPASDSFPSVARDRPRAGCRRECRPVRPPSAAPWVSRRYRFLRTDHGDS